MTAAAPRVAVFALGNPDRGDDGVGHAVAECLRAVLPSDVAIVAAVGDVLGLISHWAELDAAVCVDAAAPAGQPGRIHRFDLGAEEPAADELPRDVTVASSHAFGLAETIALARALQQAPREIVVYAIEGASFAAGTPLTPDVAAAANEAARRVSAEVERLRVGPAAINA